MAGKPNALYHHEELGALACLGCGEYIEIPYEAVLKNGQPKARIKGDPLNFLLWRELMEADHAKCAAFHDERLQKQAREYRRPQR
jgi:hypothetical protein